MKSIESVFYYLNLIIYSTCASQAEIMSQINLSCPDSPNCVSSMADSSHFIEPISFAGVPSEAKEKIKNILLNEKRMKIVKEDVFYLHAEARSLIFKFVDDVEFVIHEKAGLIQVRSASRSGYYDFGVNRRRIERITQVFKSSTN